MSDWFFDDGSAQTLLDQNYGLDHGTTSWAEPQTVSAPSEDPLFGDDPTTVAPVVITAYDRTDPAIDGHSGRETDTTQITPDAPEDPPSCTPPPNGPTPDGVDMDELRSKAKELGRQLDGLTGADGNEWGAMIYRNTDGTLEVFGPYTIGSPDNIGYPDNAVPTGSG